MPSIDLPMNYDTFIRSDTATTTYHTNTTIQVGESNAGAIVLRGLISPDFTGVPSDAIFKTAILKLTPVADASSNAAVLYCHRALGYWNSGLNTTTWNNIYAGAPWVIAGAYDSNEDYDGAKVMGFMNVDASPTLNVQLEMTLDAAELRKMFDGTYEQWGLVLFTENETNDAISYASTDHATSAYRPIITLTYSLPGGSAAMFF